MGCSCSETRLPSRSIEENLTRKYQQSIQFDSKSIQRKQTSRTQHPSPRLSDKPVKRMHFSLMKSYQGQVSTAWNDNQMSFEAMKSFDCSQQIDRNGLDQIEQINKHPQQSEYSHNITLRQQVITLSHRSSQALVVSSECDPNERHITQQIFRRDQLNKMTQMS